ncbi:response regulator transcription factor [Clostridium baratii]|uniref:Stage 0 sporulation protein A homolog n=1 Tax=Clostridium baratii TaxID=1561 RepID=A0A174RDH2_9CLOT|nr:response regulator transcription factor [Clostridium baratii]CUP83493.1 response regulator with CheY-like receiver domain and winged-helix DNA-binding domain [Clostridium baratii]
MKNILVIDDEYKIVEVIKVYLEKSGYNVITAFNGKDAIKEYENNNIDLIILDLMLPDISGEDICKTLRGKSNVPIIMLTAKIQEEDALNGFNIGADDYITKPFSPKILVSKVNAILKRIGSNEKKRLYFNYGDLVIDTASYEVFKKDEKVTLTPSEFKILLELSKNPNVVFTREELMDKTMKEDNYVYDRIIDSHIKNIRSKIEDNSKDPKYVLTVHGVGYKFGGE